MSHRLANGYAVLLVSGLHLVNGVPAKTFRSDRDKLIVITDPGNDPEELVSRTAHAVERAIIHDLSRQPSRESAIEVLHGLVFPKVPLIPDSDDRLPFRRSDPR